MELLVSDSGIVDSVSLIKGVHPVLDSSAMNVAKQFTFTPAIAGGEPVAVLIQYDYRFELKEIVKRIKEYVNFSGVLLERGTKKPIADAMVVINFVDTLSDTTLPVPFSTTRFPTSPMRSCPTIATGAWFVVDGLTVMYT